MTPLALIIPTLLAQTTGGRGWRPLLDPLPLDNFFLLFLIPLIVVIAVVYKTIKLEDLTHLPKAAAMLSVQIFAFMVLAAAVLWMLTELT